MATRLTQKEEKFVELITTIGEEISGTKAALQAYGTTDPSTAGNIASTNLRKPKIIAAIEQRKKTMAEIFDQLGATDDKIANVLIDGMNDAKKYLIKGDKLASVPDYSEKRQHAKLISELKGNLTSKVELSGDIGVSINLIAGKGYIVDEPNQEERDNISRLNSANASSTGSTV
jgi:hypothetical protein